MQIIRRIRSTEIRMEIRSYQISLLLISIKKLHQTCKLWIHFGYLTTKKAHIPKIIMANLSCQVTIASIEFHDRFKVFQLFMPKIHFMVLPMKTQPGMLMNRRIPIGAIHTQNSQFILEIITKKRKEHTKCQQSSKTQQSLSWLSHL